MIAALKKGAGSKTLCWQGFLICVPTRCILPSALRASAVGVRVLVPDHSTLLPATTAVPTMAPPAQTGSRTGQFSPSQLRFFSARPCAVYLALPHGQTSRNAQDDGVAQSWTDR